MSDKIETIASVTEFFAALVEKADKVPGLKSVAEQVPGIPLASLVISKLKNAVKEKDPEQLGYRALTIAYQHAAMEAIRIVGQPRDTLSLGSREEILKSLKSLEPPQAGLLRAFSLDRPSAHPFLWQANAQFEEVARFFGYSEEEWRKLVTHVRENFQALVSQTIAASEDFKPFREWLTLSGSEEYSARAKLLEMTERQRRAFAERPVLNIEPFALADVYLDTECGQLTWGQIVGRSDSELGPVEKLDPFIDDKEHGGRADLLATVLQLIGDKNYHDAIVIQGPPGCGKSAFTLKLSVVLLKLGFRPVRVRLKNLLQTGTLWEDISQAIQRVDEMIPSLPVQQSRM